MKIMMIITQMQAGGAERVMATLCNNLCKTNEIKLVIMKEAKSDYQLDSNIDIVSGNIKGKNFIKSVLFSAKEIKKWQPDVILSFMTKSNLIAIYGKQFSKYKAPLIIAERANPFYTKGVLSFVRKYSYPKANGCVFQTNQAQDYYKNILKCKSVVLKNPLNPDFNIVPYTGIRTKRIVTMGRLSNEKNHKLLIDAFSKISNKYPEYRVEIYGDGPLKDELQNQINSLDLTEKVFLMGRKNNIENYIKDAEIFVLPSNSEGMPNALIESMALGLACISTDCPIGGSAIIIDNNNNGILIPVGDCNELVKSLALLIEDSEYADDLRNNAIKVVEDFNAEKICRQWEDYLCQVAKNDIKIK